MSENMVIALITGFFVFIGAAITAFGSMAAIENGKGQMGCGMLGLVTSFGAVGGFFVGIIIAFFLVPSMTQTAGESSDVVGESVVVVPTAVESTQATPATTTLVVNGKSYLRPDPSSTPRCVAQDMHTDGSNIVDYDVVVPEDWVMMWSFLQAQWPNNYYNNDGLLIINGPWSGRIQINTGGSCSGPKEWYNFIKENRINYYPVPSRPEFPIP